MPRKRSRLSRPSTRRIGEYILAGFLSLAIIWLLILVWGIARKEELARHAEQDTKAELASLTARKQALQRNLAELQTPRGQEATLRQDFGVAKPGEEVIVVVPPKIASTTPSKTFWQQWFSWLPFVK